MSGSGCKCKRMFSKLSLGALSIHRLPSDYRQTIFGCFHQDFDGVNHHGLSQYQRKKVGISMWFKILPCPVESVDNFQDKILRFTNELEVILRYENKTRSRTHTTLCYREERVRKSLEVDSALLIWWKVWWERKRVSFKAYLVFNLTVENGA